MSDLNILMTRFDVQTDITVQPGLSKHCYKKCYNNTAIQNELFKI